MGSVTFIRAGLSGVVGAATTFNDTITLEPATDINVPSGETFVVAVNSVTEMELSATDANFQSNSVTTTGGGSFGTLANTGVQTASAAVNITIADTGNDVPLEVTQNDTTNNPVAATITNTGTGNSLQVANGSGNLVTISSAGAIVGL